MTRDEVISFAREAGIRVMGDGFDKPDRTDVWATQSEFEKFAALVVASEQDRCCSIVFGQCGSDNVAQRTVDAIRGKK